MNKWAIVNGVILSSSGIIPDGGIGIKGDKIADIGSSEEIKMRYENFVDAGGRLLLPGLVNFHTHLYSALSPGLKIKGSLKNFKEILENLWWKLDRLLNEKILYYSALKGVMDAVKSGVTTIFDHNASMNFVSGSLSVIEEVIKKAGIRGVLCFETSDRGNIHEHIKENVDFINTHRNDPSVMGMFGLHANFTLSDDTLKRVKETIPDGAPIHIHCGEDKIDFDYSIKMGYKGPVQRLDSFGLLTEKSILAHCIHLSEEDFNIINDFKPIVASNPQSNLNNRVGAMNRDKIKEFVLGTDGFGQDIIFSLKILYLSGKGKDEDFQILYKVFFENSKKWVREFFPNTGEIAEGMSADIVVTDYIPPATIDSPVSLLSHLIFGFIPTTVWMTVSMGRPVYREGKFSFIDDDDIEKIKQSGIELHKRFQNY